VRTYVGMTRRLARTELELDWEVGAEQVAPPEVGDALTVYVAVPGRSLFGQRYLMCAGTVEAAEPQTRGVAVKLAVAQMRYKRFPKAMSAAGHAAVELALMSPWIFALFLGVFDFGFYAYAAIATQNAARSAAMFTSAGSSVASASTNACQYALQELRGLPNVGPNVTTCATAISGITDAQPLAVTAQFITGSGVTPDGEDASRVTVTYLTPRLFVFPGMAGRMQLTRITVMRLRE
jgi:Flp pilus assembly protein TadG